LGDVKLLKDLLLMDISLIAEQTPLLPGVELSHDLSCKWHWSCCKSDDLT
jgi:hypothetical protein